MLLKILLSHLQILYLGYNNSLLFILAWIFPSRDAMQGPNSAPI